VTQFTIDATPPTQFSLSAPSNSTISKDLTPTLDWADTVEANFKNYTIQVSDSPTFAWINYTYETTESVTNSSMTAGNDWTTDHVWYWRVIAYDKANNSRTSNQTFKYITDTRPPIFVAGTQSVSPTSVTQGNPVTISIDVTSDDYSSVSWVKAQITKPSGEVTNWTMTKASGDTYTLSYASTTDLGDYAIKYFFTEDNATGSPGNANATSSNLTFSVTYSAGGGTAGGGGGLGVVIKEKEIINITEITIEPGRIDTIFIFMPFDGMETWAEWQYVFTVSPLPASVMCSDPFTCGITPEERINITYKPTSDDFITKEITGEVHITDIHDQIGHVKVTVTIINLAAYLPIYEFTSPHIPGMELFFKTEPITTTEDAAPVLYPLTIGGVEGDVSSNVKVTGIRLWWVALIGLFVGIYLGYMFLRGYY